MSERAQIAPEYRDEAGSLWLVPGWAHKQSLPLIQTLTPLAQGIARLLADATSASRRHREVEMTAVAEPRRRGLSRIQRREDVLGYLWISPWLIGLLVFTLGPMIASFFFSFTTYRIIKPAQWIGLHNYVYALTEDDLFWPSLGRTFYFVLISVPLGLLGSLLLASLLNQRVRGESIFRTHVLPPFTDAFGRSSHPLELVAALQGRVGQPSPVPGGHTGSTLVGLPAMGHSLDHLDRPLDRNRWGANDHLSRRLAGRAHRVL